MATNLIIANVETLNHDVSNSNQFSSDGHEFNGGITPWHPSESATTQSYFITMQWGGQIFSEEQLSRGAAYSVHMRLWSAVERRGKEVEEKMKEGRGE